MITCVVRSWGDLVKAANEIRQVWDKKTPHVFTWKAYRRRRSIPQNNLYWKWLSCIEEETGNDKNDLHWVYRCRFLGFVQVTVMDEEVMVPRSTTTLDTGEFTVYLDKIHGLATQYNIHLPYPGDPGWDEFDVRY